MTITIANEDGSVLVLTFVPAREEVAPDKFTTEQLGEALQRKYRERQAQLRKERDERRSGNEL